MKKLAAFCMAVSMVAALTACGGGSSAPATTAAPAATEAPKEEAKEEAPEAEAPAEASGDAIVLRMADNQADGTPNVEGDKHFIDLVSEYTGGTVQIELYNNAVLGDETSCADMLEADALDLCRISTNGIAPTCTAFNVFGLPYVFASDEQKYAALDGEFGQTLTQTLEDETGLINLTYFVSGPRSFYTVEKPINSVADMKGLKLRTQDDEIMIATMEALGASATPMNYSEVYSALETKVIDGAENDFTSYYSSGHYEVAKYYSLDMHTAPSSLVVMSAGAWNSLSPEQQEQVKKAAEDTVQFQRDQVASFTEEARAAVEEAGCSIIEVDVAEFQEACSQVYDKYPEYADLLALIK